MRNMQENGKIRGMQVVGTRPHPSNRRLIDPGGAMPQDTNFHASPTAQICDEPPTVWFDPLRRSYLTEGTVVLFLKSKDVDNRKPVLWCSLVGADETIMEEETTWEGPIPAIPARMLDYVIPLLNERDGTHITREHLGWLLRYVVDGGEQ